MCFRARTLWQVKREREFRLDPVRRRDKEGKHRLYFAKFRTKLRAIRKNPRNSVRIPLRPICTLYPAAENWLSHRVILEHVENSLWQYRPLYRLEDSVIDYGMWLTPIAGRAVPVVIKGDLFQFSPRNVRNASTRKRTPSMMLMDPLAKPVSRNDELWLSLWKKSMFNAPAAMNRAHPISEKKRSCKVRVSDLMRGSSCL